jgi:NAD(P)H-hydrate repair Nnr-like enzyme with NAD(P)H-hydrate epimerase domain/8-oxo-dGTP pyrophosphatase MutT (NUDIX family)
LPAWKQLTDGLAGFPAAALATPEGGRLGAALVILSDAGDGDLQVVLTRRRDDLSHHPGQISFPGGRVDAGESVEEAALREAHEEVGLDRGSVEVLGRLPAFYIPPSRFWLQTVVARWIAPHPLVAAEAEVAEILEPRLSALRDRSRWRTVRLSSAAHTWAWQLDERHLLWGATAIVTSVLLGLLDADWHGGTDPAHLPRELEVRPWEQVDRAVPRRLPARLPGNPEVAAAGIDPSAEPLAPPTAAEAETAGALLAAAAHRLLQASDSSGPVLALVGPGGKGLAVAAAACVLEAEGVPVRVVTTRPAIDLLAATGELLRRSGVETAVFADALPSCAAVIDGLVGSGLRGPLKGEPLRAVEALRHHAVPVISLDVPSGLHPVSGLVGECLAADVTIAVGAPRQGLLHAGLGPFVGDLYLVPEPVAFDGDEAEGFGDAPLVRLVAEPERRREGWRE